MCLIISCCTQSILTMDSEHSSPFQRIPVLQSKTPDINIPASMPSNTQRSMVSNNKQDIHTKFNRRDIAHYLFGNSLSGDQIQEDPTATQDQNSLCADYFYLPTDTEHPEKSSDFQYFLTAKNAVLNIYHTALSTSPCIEKLASVCRSIATNDGIAAEIKETLFKLALKRYQFFKQKDLFQYSGQHQTLFMMLFEFQILKSADIVIDNLD